MMKSSSSIPRVGCSLDTVQDFLIKLGIKPGMHLWEIEQSRQKLGTFLEKKVLISNRCISGYAQLDQKILDGL